MPSVQLDFISMGKPGNKSSLVFLLFSILISFYKDESSLKFLYAVNYNQDDILTTPPPQQLGVILSISTIC